MIRIVGLLLAIMFAVLTYNACPPGMSAGRILLALVVAGLFCLLWETGEALVAPTDLPAEDEPVPARHAVRDNTRRSPEDEGTAFL